MSSPTYASFRLDIDWCCLFTEQRLQRGRRGRFRPPRATVRVPARQRQKSKVRFHHPVITALYREAEYYIPGDYVFNSHLQDAFSQGGEDRTLPKESNNPFTDESGIDLSNDATFVIIGRRVIVGGNQGFKIVFPVVVYLWFVGYGGFFCLLYFVLVSRLLVEFVCFLRVSEEAAPHALLSHVPYSSDGTRKISVRL